MTRAYTVALCVLTLAMSGHPLRTCQAQSMAEIRADNPAEIPLSLIAVGARYGTNAVTDKAGAMDRVDVFWNWRTPYAWEYTPGWEVGARLEASIGAIRGQGQTGAVGTLVPRIAIGDTDNVFAFEGGVGIAVFTKWEYGTVEDFGGPIQFILDLGMNFRVYERLGLGYRLQHWSDGGIYGSGNRGVEMHLFELSYRF